jgi:hypothetical protein
MMPQPDFCAVALSEILSKNAYKNIKNIFKVFLKPF